MILKGGIACRATPPFSRMFSRHFDDCSPLIFRRKFTDSPNLIL